ncbi:MAG: phosphotransferase [Chloroflexi bacterium]|nr:phosphotransferase [Chloroflexota bacterium]
MDITRPSVFPVTHSVLSAEALLAEIVPEYDLAEAVECRFLNRGLTDTYLVRTAGDQYILRVYRTGWRTDSDVLYEIEVLNHLDRKGVPVSTPLAGKEGRGALGAVSARLWRAAHAERTGPRGGAALRRHPAHLAAGPAHRQRPRLGLRLDGRPLL